MIGSIEEKCQVGSQERIRSVASLHYLLHMERMERGERRDSLAPPDNFSYSWRDIDIDIG